MKAEALVTALHQQSSDDSLGSYHTVILLMSLWKSLKIMCKTCSGCTNTFLYKADHNLGLITKQCGCYASLGVWARAGSSLLWLAGGSRWQRYPLPHTNLLVIALAQGNCCKDGQSAWGKLAGSGAKHGGLECYAPWSLAGTFLWRSQSGEHFMFTLSMSCVRARSALTALVNPRRRKKNLAHTTQKGRDTWFSSTVLWYRLLKGGQ